jgi:hypothetical protein
MLAAAPWFGSPVRSHSSLPKIDLIPAERAQLGDAQPVAVGDQDHGGIAVPVPVLPCGADQALDFSGGQVFAGAALGVGNRPGRNCPIFTSWYGGWGQVARHRANGLARTQLSHSGSKMGQFSAREGHLPTL